MLRIGTDEQLVRELLRASRLKDGADVAVPRRSPEGGGTRNSGRPSRKGRTVGLLGTNSPKKEAV
jgi:hypothetical protein